jgi:hypothetical protein
VSTRFDRAPITSRNVERLADGRLRVRATFSRVGPLNYMRSDGSLQVEHVTADELFRADSLETAGLAAVTLNHPPDGMVTPKNWKEYNVGASGSQVEANRQDGLVSVVFVVGDEEAIDAVESGRATEVSAGYSTTVEQRDDGKFYQTNRQYNHLALVERGRAGPDVRLHLDAADDWAVMTDDEQSHNDAKGGCMGKYKGFEMDEGGIAAFKQMEEDMAAMKEDMKGMVPKKDAADSVAAEKIDALAGENAGLRTRVAALEADLGTRLDASAVEAAATARLDAYMECLPLLPEGVKFDAGLEPIDWRKAAIAASNPSVELDGRSDDFVNGMFSTMQVGTKQAAAKTQAVKADKFRQVLDSAVTAGHEGVSGVPDAETEMARQDAEDIDAINNLFAFGGAN